MVMMSVSSTTAPTQSATRLGVMATACAFFIWGLLPLYLKPLNGIAALQIAAWRYTMGLVTLLTWLSLRGELAALWQVLKQPHLMGRLTLTGALLAINWTLYAWGVAHGQVLVTSLGYFINPLVNVLLGIVVLAERLNGRQWLAVAIAALSVLGLTIHTGHLPWLALSLAVTFSVYGLLRKTTPVAPLIGLTCESLIYAPLALAYLLYCAHQQGSVWPTADLQQGLLLLSGVVSIVPLGLFNFGARRISYASVGMLQYIGPTLQFLIGYFIYHEVVSRDAMLCFMGIWLALLIYAADSVMTRR